MHISVRSVQLNADRTGWTRDGLRISLLGDRNDHCHPIDRPPRRGVFDVLVEGMPVTVQPGSVLPPPILIDGHLVAPIVRAPDDRLALDVDESERPITRSWRPKPADLRCERSIPDGLGIALDLELTAPRDDWSTASLDVELVLQRAAREHVVPARLLPGPGAVGRLVADLDSDLLRPGEHWMLSLRTAHEVDRLGVDLAVSAAGQPYARPTTAVTVLIVLSPDQPEAARQIGDCISSALDQTLPREHYEVLVVEAGSTDGTAGLLDWLATLHPRLRVLHLAAARAADSVVRRGIVGARGEFVYFLHPTERLTPNALRDLLGYARLHDADIVAGRMVDASGRTLAPTTFRRSLPYATVAGTHLAESLQPAKLFRGSLLDQHELSFGSDRSDRQRFVAESCLLADRVAVFSERVCCRQTDDEPGRAPTAAEHAAGVARAAAALRGRAGADSGAYLRFLRRWYRTEVLHRLRGAPYLELSPAERAEWVDELATLAERHFGPELARGFLPADQLVARLLALAVREPDEALQALESLAEWECTIDLRAEARWLRPTREGLQVSARILLSAHGAPMFRTVRREPGTPLAALDPPMTAAPRGTAPDPRSVTRHLEQARIELAAETTDGVTFRAHPRSVRFDGSDFRVWAEVPTVGLPGGRYRLIARVRCCGWDLTAPVRSGAAVLARQRRLHPPVPHLGHGPIAIDVPPNGGRPHAALYTDPPKQGLRPGLGAVLRTLGSE